MPGPRPGTNGLNLSRTRIGVQRMIAASACFRHCRPHRLAADAIALLLVTAVPAIALADTATAGQLGLVNKGLVGVVRLPVDLRDKLGETTVSGSGMAVDTASWTRTAQG